MTALPKNPFENVAISMSGGGYRATTFHLGTLAYVSTLQWKEVSLLDRIRVISSVSGGTFTAIQYAAAIKQGRSFHEAFRDLYGFMKDEDLIKNALECLANDSYWNGTKQRSLINAVSIVYHQKLQSEHFRLLFRPEPEIHLKEIIFNATEFNFGLPFRHQKTELTQLENGALTHGIVGNYQIQIPQECAEEMRLADILASSSCFPLGFEPINFPNDFIDSESRALRIPELFPKESPAGMDITYPIGLMDGGIDDNQGIDSVVAAEKRMRDYPPENRKYASQDVRALDLFIISDVSSPYMQGYMRMEKTTIPVIGNWSFRTLKFIGILSFILGVGAFIGAYAVSKDWVTVGLSVAGTVLVILAWLLRTLSKGFEGLTEAVGVPSFFTKRLRSFDTLNFNTYANLIVNRAKSADLLISEVFMKQIRRKQYDLVYDDEAWRPRLVMNAVYELNYENCDMRNRLYNEPLPSEVLQQTAEAASSMGTTLWFTSEEKNGRKSQLNALIACGQFTICYNLKDYIERTMRVQNKEAYDAYPQELKDEIEVLYQQLLKDWAKFNEDPYWMMDDFIG